jgi:CubicO group peptidase (beta-lactamase class C family)
MAADHIAGVVVSVVQNGKLILEKGYGFSALSPDRKIDPRTTLVRLGSASQIFTWIAALKAVEDGKLNLDRPVNSYLPDALQLPDEGFNRPILFNHLMSHSAGFEDRRFGRRYFRAVDELLPLEDALRSQRPRRVRRAGVISVPSDYGSALAGFIVSRVEGKPFDQMIEAEVLKPLGLAHTSFREPYAARSGLPDPLSPALTADLTSNFHWTGRGLASEPFAYGQSLAPAIAASSTADDMARLMIALLNDGAFGQSRLLSPSAATLLARPLLAPTAGAAGSAHGLMQANLKGGLGALVDAGSGSVSQSTLFVLPAMNLGVFVAANTDSGAALTRGLPAAIAEHFSGAAPSSAWLAPQERTAGTYLSEQRASHGLEAFVDRLTKTARLGTDGAGGFILNERGRAQRYAPTAVADLYAGADGSQLYIPTPNGDRPPIYVLGSGGGAGERVDGVHRLSALIVTAAAAALGILVNFASLFIRNHVDERQTRSQTTAAITQGIACSAWIGAFSGFGLFLAGGLDTYHLLFDWPNTWLTLASWSALVATLLCVLMLVQIPGVWREERRIHGWSVWRKFRHTTTIFVFLGFATVLAAWGALEPWSS